MPSKLPRHIEYRPLDQITPAVRNAKGHSPEVIGASIDRLGFLDPMIEDGRTGRLIAGHGRLEQLQTRHAAGDPAPEGVQVRAGKWYVPVTVGWASSDDTQAEAAGLVLNRATESGGWADDVLAKMLTDQPDPTWLGWDEDELAALLGAGDDSIPGLGGSGEELQSDPDEVPDSAPAITTPGDVWLLGEHRLMAGDCRDPDQVARLLDGATVNLAFTSPPYAEQRTYDETSGFKPISPDKYVDWFEPVASNVATHLADDGSWFVNIKAASRGLDTETYVLDLVLAHVRQWGWHWVTEFCWERPGIPQEPNGRFKNAFEPVYQLSRDRWKHRPDAVRVQSKAAFGYGGLENRRDANDQGGDLGWDSDLKGDGLAYPSNRLPTFAGSHTATGHGAAFPVGLPAWFTRAYTDPGDVVYDPFVGSGSTIIAAHIEGRIGYGMEISPGYCDIVCRRFQEVSGEMPARESGEPVDFIGTAT